MRQAAELKSKAGQRFRSWLVTSDSHESLLNSPTSEGPLRWWPPLLAVAMLAYVAVGALHG
jgi:hypothetical protein